MNLHRLHNVLRNRFAADNSDLKALRLARKVKTRLQSATKQKQMARKKIFDVAEYDNGGFAYKLVKHALDNNLKIVSFDAEWSHFNPLTELGLTVYQDGQMTSYNIRLVKKKWRRFHYGESVNMSRVEGLKWLVEMLSDTDLLVGHALENDRLQLRKVGMRFSSDLKVVDTHYWSRLVMRTPMGCSLKKLAAHFDVKTIGAHVAGNDARMVMGCVLAAMGHFNGG